MKNKNMRDNIEKKKKHKTFKAWITKIQQRSIDLSSPARGNILGLILSHLVTYCHIEIYIILSYCHILLLNDMERSPVQGDYYSTKFYIILHDF